MVFYTQEFYFRLLLNLTNRQIFNELKTFTNTDKQN